MAVSIYSDTRRISRERPPVRRDGLPPPTCSYPLIQLRCMTPDVHTVGPRENSRPWNPLKPNRRAPRITSASARICPTPSEPPLATSTLLCVLSPRTSRRWHLEIRLLTPIEGVFHSSPFCFYSQRPGTPTSREIDSAEIPRRKRMRVLIRWKMVQMCYSLRYCVALRNNSTFTLLKVNVYTLYNLKSFSAPFARVLSALKYVASASLLCNSESSQSLSTGIRFRVILFLNTSSTRSNVSPFLFCWPLFWQTGPVVRLPAPESRFTRPLPLSS